MVQMEESIGLPRNDIAPQAGALAENAVNKRMAETVTRTDWGSMRGEVDRFEQYLAGVKQASWKIPYSLSERSDADDYLSGGERDPGGGEGDKDQPEGISSSSMEEQGKAVTTISWMMAAIKAFC